MNTKKRFRDRQLWQKCLIIMLSLILIAALSFGCLIGYLTITEFNPDKEILLNLTGAAEAEEIDKSKEVTAVTWNIGYAGLDPDADFFMDGGKQVQTTTKDGLYRNMQAISTDLDVLDPDIIMLQEIDKDSSRTFRIDEVKMLQDDLLKHKYQASFAENFNVKFIPYPLPPMGKVESGIMTLSKIKISEAKRIQLPIPFKWPVRIANLKRCLSINRLPIKGSDKELVLVNLHLEAYDDGEGKKAQTAMLNKYLQSELDKGNYVVAGGDFNQIFSGADTSTLKTFEGTWKPPILNQSEFDKSWQFLMDTETPSCRSLDKPLTTLDTDKFQFYIIDGFIVSGNIDVSSIETKQLGFENSDHNPVIIKFKLK